MASISSVSGSSGTSSLYNSANIISGLASGMDTEGMIESLVQSYSQKIQSLTNNITKIGWKQDIYRNIISSMTAFSSKYTSYTSSTNLMSSAFFNSAVKVAAQGKNAEKVTASGRTDSDIVLNGVSQLATAARYVTNGTGLKADGGNSVVASGFKDKDGAPLLGLDMDSDITLGTLNGSLSFGYGGKTVTISFDEATDQIGVDENGQKVELTREQKTQQLADMITEKLGKQTISLSSGEAVSADTRIGVKVDEKSGKISFYDKANAGNTVKISSASDSVKSTLKLGNLNDSDNPVQSIGVSNTTAFTKNVKAYSYLSGKSFNINVDGTTKTIQMPQIKKVGDEYTLTMPSTVKDQYGNVTSVYDTSKLDTSKYTVTKQGESVTVDSLDKIADEYTRMLQEGVNKAFGSKLKVENLAEGSGKLKLKFTVNDGSNLLINHSAGKTLGIGKSATNYLNTSDTLENLLKDGALDEDTMAVKDKDGNVVKDKNGNTLYEFKINGETIGQYTKDSTLAEIMNDINNNKDANVKVSYSRTTRQFVFTSRETGSENEVKIDGGLAEAIFGSTAFDEESPKFTDAYGLVMRPGTTQAVTFGLPGADVTINIADTDTIEDVAEKLNSNMFNHGQSASFNKYTGQLEIKDENGAAMEYEAWVDYGISDLNHVTLEFDKSSAPTANYTPGQDARFKVTVDGVEKELTRGSNSVEIDGMTINFNDTFNETYKADSSESVTFKTTTDADKIVDAVKSMISDYNAMMSELRNAYATMPYQNSSGAFQSYEPLTDEEKATMSESAIEKYEEKAKQGILFGDSNLRALYERMRDVFQPTGADAALLSKIGISTSFSSTDNSTTIVLDESKFREALENNVDEVADLFTRSTESGASSNGLMQGLKVQLDRYAGLTGATKGILVQQAGTPLNSLSLLDNQWQKQIDNITTQIEKWQDKLESQVDRYTSMFSKLEVLINQMNSQSSTLAGLMGG